jgi:hypothetical protein
MKMEETLWKDIEIGFVRKSDGKILNFKLIDVFKRFITADFVNNEIKINGETLIADSFQKPYYEVRLDVQKNSLNGGNGSYQVNGETFSTNKSFVVAKDSQVQSTLIPDQNSLVKSVRDENNIEIPPVNNVVTIGMEKDHVVTIDFDIQQPQ